MVADYDFWVLDLDGTLVDIQSGYTYNLFERVGDRIGYDFSREQADILWHGLGGPRDEQLRHWNVDVERFWEVFHDEEDPLARAEATYLYDDAERFGDFDRPLALVTHCQAYLTQPVLDHVDIADWFDAVVCCTNETGWKPDSDPVERAMAEMDATGDGVLAGDGPHDVGAAWNAGLDGVHVERHDPEVRGLCVLGDHRVESFDELWRRDPAASD